MLVSVVQAVGCRGKLSNFANVISLFGETHSICYTQSLFTHICINKNMFKPSHLTAWSQTLSLMTFHRTLPSCPMQFIHSCHRSFNLTTSYLSGSTPPISKAPSDTWERDCISMVATYTCAASHSFPSTFNVLCFCSYFSMQSVYICFVHTKLHVLYVMPCGQQ